MFSTTRKLQNRSPFEKLMARPEPDEGASGEEVKMNEYFPFVLGVP
jgi:hypothetical protein